MALGVFLAGMVVWIPGPVHAQLSSLDFSAEWRWADFDPASGYRGGRAQQMLEVGDTLWVRADEGIHWFDGFFWHWMGDGEGLPLGRPTSLFRREDGRLVTVFAGDLYVGNSDGFSPLTHPGWDATRFHTVQAVGSPFGMVVIALDGEEEQRSIFLWVEGGVEEIPPPDGALTVSRLWNSSDGSALLNTDAGLWKLGEEGWELRVTSGDGPFRIPAVWDDTHGQLFAAISMPLSQRGIVAWAEGDLSYGPIPTEGEDNIVSGTVTAGGPMVVVYESENVRILENGVWSSASLPYDRASGIHFVYEDHLGDLWFASSRGLHLFRRSLRRWSAIQFPFPDSRNRVNDVLPSPEAGALWMATDGGLVRLRQDEGIEGISRIGNQALGAVTGLARDSAGGVWVSSGASFHGAFRWMDGGWERFGPEEGFDVGRVHRIEVTGDGAIWFLSLGGGAPDGLGGAYRFHEGELEHIRDGQGWLDTRVYALAEGEDGTLWFGTRRGLVRLSGGQWSRWGPSEGVIGSGAASIFTLLPDSVGGIWWGYGPDSNRGLGRLDRNGVLSYLAVEDGLPGNAVNEIIRDAQGIIWLSTDWGVARFDGSEWNTFGGAAGLSPSKAWPLAFQGSSLFIGTTGGGLQVLDRREEENPPPQVTLQGPVVVDGKTVRVRWRALGYRGEVAPEQAFVRDRFDDGEWSDWGQYRELWTSEGDDLSWGSHRIEIQARGLFGQSSDPLVAEFVIPYPVFFRPVFYLPFLGMLLGILLGWRALHRRRLQTAESVRRSEARLRTLVDTAPDGITIYDASADRFTDVNKNILWLTGLTREEFLETRLGGTSPSVAPDGRTSREFLLEKVNLALLGEEVRFDWSSRAKSGETIPTEVRLVRLPSAMGNLVRFSVLDVRDRKLADSRREELEAQLRQSQKLEAVGQLTGGVAHDFNNLLTVILGNMDLLKDIRGEDPEILELAESAIGAAERSAVLTQRLLAFSRRQALHTKTIDLPVLVEGLLNLLMRSLGERVRVQADFPGGLWTLSADPGQLEHTLINLAVNARDAMPRGGELSIEAHNVTLEEEVALGWGGEPGEYVCVSVTDTGTGMAPDVRVRAIDPFFTTKEVGAGSGLGLSMVYGFANQSGGFLQIHSKEGMGTAVQVFLPRAWEGDSSPEEDSRPEPVGGSGEVVLVVEDEPLLLQLTSRLCRRLGYEVLEATTGEEALETIESGAPVHVLFSDVVLPEELNGVELAQAARKHIPGLPVLFTSGYTRQFMERLSKDLPNFEWVPKPFDGGTLARKLRSVLRNRSQGGTQDPKTTESKSDRRGTRKG